MSQPMPDRLVFDDVVIDFAGRRLWRGGVEQMLEPKAFAVLALLVDSPGRVFSRDEILDAVWGHRHVTQGVLNRITSLLRQALGEDAHRPRLLHTVHGIGYRFDLPPPAPVTEALAVSGPAPESGSKRGIRFAGWAAVVLVALAGIVWLRPGGIAGLMAADGAFSNSSPPSLAVLPFADLSQSRDQENVADGLTEEIHERLARAPGLRVVGSASSLAFKGQSADLRDVGRTLGASHLLEGSVRRDGDRLLVVVQLVRTHDGMHQWSRVYERDVSDISAVQDEISRDVAQALTV